MYVAVLDRLDLEGVDSNLRSIHEICEPALGRIHDGGNVFVKVYLGDVSKGIVSRDVKSCAKDDFRANASNDAVIEHETK